MSLEKINSILSSYHYRVGFSSYHKQEELLLYKDSEKNICGDEFLTIYTKEGLVIGRLTDFKKGSDFTEKHFQEIRSFFTTYELPDNLAIVEKLDQLVKK